MSDHPLFEHVPSILRDHVPDYETTLPAILGPKLAEAGVEETLHYIRGAIAHQEALNEEDQKGGLASKWFKGTITSVDRENRGKIGAKAKITFDDSRSGKEQFIHTGWVKYNFSWDIPYWELSLSRTLEETAESLIGEEVLLRKAFTVGAENEQGNSRYRYLADIRKLNSANDDLADDEDDEPITEGDIDSFLDDAEVDFDLEDGDYRLIVSLEGKKKSAVETSIADYLEMESDDLEVPSKKQYDETWEYAILLLALNAE